MSDFSLFKAAIHRDITEKLKAFLMYERFNNTGNKDIDDTVNLAFGIAYMYAPSVIFQLQYDWRDYGQGKDNVISGEENTFRFRTLFYFY